MSFLEKLTGDLADKRRWREYKARMKALPEPYRSVVDALERYLLNVGGISRGDVLVSMVNDLAELFETAAAERTPVRAIVGDDPIEFVETFLANYDDGSWRAKERARLVAAVERAAAQGARDDDRD